MYAALREILRLIGHPSKVQSKDPFWLKMARILDKTISLTLVCVSKILARLSITI
jgi:hypothetical protein